MKRTVLFIMACAGLIGLMWLIAVQLVPGADARRALTLAAIIATGVQVMAFLIARAMSRRNVMAGWGIGVALRFGALAIVALVAVPRLGMPLTATLLGLAAFLFVSTLIEPLFLKQ